MGAKVQIEFVKRHGWHRPYGFHVYCSPGDSLVFDARMITGQPVRLWSESWEKAGFGAGRFGFGSFGWAQGKSSTGGFGYGRFGAGEFGYYNAVVQWTTPQTFEDGLYAFGVELVADSFLLDPTWQSQTVLVMSKPDVPRRVAVAAATSDAVTLAWT